MGMDLRAIEVLIRTGGKPYVKESQDSRTSDHPCFGPRVNGENWSLENSVLKILSLQYLLGGEV